MLFQLELGDAVAEQTADAICFFVDYDRVPCAAQLLSSSQARRAGAYDGYLFPDAHLSRLGTNPAFLESALDDALLVLLDGYWWLVDSQHAGRLARRGTDPARELWKIVRRVELTYGVLPAAAIYQIVPVRNQIVDGTAGLTERYSAIHTARALAAKFFLGKIEIDFKPVVHPLRYGTAGSKLTRVFEEAGSFTHAVPARLLREQPWFLRGCTPECYEEHLTHA